MNWKFWKSALLITFAIGGFIGKNNKVLAQEKKIYDPQLDQVTSVDSLRDVSPSDWAYEALKSLVERYNCLAGFPDRTYKGNKTLTRYEFAAGLNSCLNQIERLAVLSSPSDSEPEIIDRLTKEFSTELSTLKTRIDNLENRTALVEKAQFSTTTKLEGEIIFGLGSIITGEGDENPVLGHRTRLELNSSFTGDDLLFTRLATGNFPSFGEETNTFAGDLAFAEPAENNLSLEVLFYTFSIGKNTEIILGATGTAADDILNTISILDGDGGSGAISAFGTRSPIFLPPGDAGLGINHTLSDTITINAGYLASPANDPSDDGGIFNAPYSAMGQIVFTPVESLNIALTYRHSRNQTDTETGSNRANIASFTSSIDNEDGVPTVSDSYGIQFSWDISDRFILGGWGGFSKVTTLSSLDNTIDRGTQDIWNWATTFAFPDLGKEGNMGGIIIGMEPWVTSSSINTVGEDDNNSFHIEAFYEHQINDNIAITPGIVWITAPNNNNDNDDLVIGTIRTTFSF